MHLFQDLVIDGNLLKTQLTKSAKKPNYELECSSHLEVLQAVKSKCFCGILPTFLSNDLPIKYFKHIAVKELAEMHGKLVIAWKRKPFTTNRDQNCSQRYSKYFQESCSTPKIIFSLQIRIKHYLLVSIQIYNFV